MSAVAASWRKARVRALIVWIAVCLGALCSACDGSVDALFQRDPFDTHDGPLSAAEIDVFWSQLPASVSAPIGECLQKEVMTRAAQAGDPETLNPAAVDMLPARDWGRLDQRGKRVILTQVVFNQSIVACTRARRQ